MSTPVFHRSSRLQYPILSFVLTLLFALTASAQIITGTIQGTVQDSNGAVVPGANVVIKHLETNSSRTLVTDEQGFFNAPQLITGVYSVTVSKQGFATAEDPSVRLTVGQTAGLTFNLKPSSVAETVTVTATQVVDV